VRDAHFPLTITPWNYFFHMVSRLFSGIYLQWE